MGVGGGGIYQGVDGKGESKRRMGKEETGEYKLYTHFKSN